MKTHWKCCVVVWAAMILPGATTQLHAQAHFIMSTGCAHGAPKTVLRDLSLADDTVALQEMEAHEAVHREQLSRPGHTCEEWLKLYNSDPDHLIDVEREAYQAQARWDVAHYGAMANVDEFWFRVSKKLYAFLDGKVSYQHVVERLGGDVLVSVISQKPGTTQASQGFVDDASSIQDKALEAQRAALAAEAAVKKAVTKQ